MEEEKDWLFPKAGEQKAAQEEKGLAFAQKYLVFLQDPRARELLEYWASIARRKRIPANASVGEYAAHNAFREFIEGIHAQIEFAQNGLNQPRVRTTNGS